MMNMPGCGLSGVAANTKRSQRLETAMIPQAMALKMSITEKSRPLMAGASNTMMRITSLIEGTRTKTMCTILLDSIPYSTHFCGIFES
jgi:hypothetical protein